METVKLLLDSRYELPSSFPFPGARVSPLTAVAGEVLVRAASLSGVRAQLVSRGYGIDDARPAGAWTVLNFTPPEHVTSAAEALHEILVATNQVGQEPVTRVSRIVGCPRLMGGNEGENPPEPLSRPHALPLGTDPGTGVRVAVLDTPLVYHEDFVGPIANMPQAVVWDLDAEVVGAARGHSLLVAGIVLRYAPGATIEVVPVLDDDGVGSDGTLAAALANLDDEVDFVNLSLESREAQLPGVEAALRTLAERGVGMIAAAGNMGERDPVLPAAADDVVGVAAIVDEGSNLHLTRWTDRGAWVRAAARGVNRFGPFVHGRRLLEKDAQPAAFHGWCAWDGTSFAAPVVTGAAAAHLGAQRRAGRQMTGREALEELLEAADRVNLEPDVERDPTRARLIDPEPIWPRDRPVAA